ncbi:hypothetical protein ColLi_10895 [Colletotrichum liriopes]|uniref:BAH domain-containing protein n=1 Tax=Colletotrichum liriopes TaxID=708192 RepID=A0AA37GW20_9PEZI|nr:hypothetical protein ColLi_10895 [Colletotrichum liriopes]
MSSTKRKRPLDRMKEATSPFVIRYTERNFTHRKRRPNHDITPRAKTGLRQPCPFAPTGLFNGENDQEALGLDYSVLPEKDWDNMTQYNSFILNGVKYFREVFVHVANSQSVKLQGIEVEEAASNNRTSGGRRKSKSEGDWVAFILEIRASDKQHVYARVYWMYWPEELPEGTMDGERYPGGRQSYHGRNELIASNHMDIINVISVTSPVDVEQWKEEDNQDAPEALYWRQALDYQTKQLSSVTRFCACQQSANFDKTLIGCPNGNCIAKWLHENCLQKDALARAYQRFAEERFHPFEESPATRVVQVTVSGMKKRERLPEDDKKESFSSSVCSATGDQPSEAEPRKDSRAPEKQLARTATLTTPSDIVTPSKALLSTFVKSVSGEQESVKANETSNEEFLEAKILMDTDPPSIEIKVLSKEVALSGKGWTESLRCILCGSLIK